MKVLVIGGNGFIGSHVVDALFDRGIQVTVFGRLQKTQAQYLLPESPFDFFHGDVKDREAVIQAVGLHDGVINLAGILGTSETVANPYPSVWVNVIGGLNFLQACREHNKPGVQITVGNHFMNNSYAITKTTIERLALMYNKEHKTKIAIVRGLNAYGPRQKHTPVRKIMPNFICRSLRSKPIEIYGNGEQVMDMIYVKDLADILVRALLEKHDVYDEIFSAGTGVETTVNDIALTVDKCTLNVHKPEHLPMRQGEPENAHVVGNPETLLPLYGGKKPKLTKLKDGVKETVDWYKEFYPYDEV